MATWTDLTLVLVHRNGLKKDENAIPLWYDANPSNLPELVGG
jgi:hypothetical protein